MPSRRLLPWLYLTLLLALAMAGFFIPWDEVLTQGQSTLASIHQWVADHHPTAALAYCLLYILFTGLSLPGSLFLTILGGWLFGPITILYVSFASSAGATIACFLSRTILRDRLLARYQGRWTTFQIEFERYGWLYLLALRLNPLIPYFLINLFFGFTKMPLWQFWIVSQIGMIPITCLYVWAGSELAQVQTLRGLLSTNLLAAFISASLVPIFFRIARRLLRSQT